MVASNHIATWSRDECELSDEPRIAVTNQQSSCGVSVWPNITLKGFKPIMWKPTNAPSASPSPNPTPEPQRNVAAPIEPAAAPRPATPAMNTQEQATLGKSLVIKGEVTGSESLYIDGRVEGSINLPGNRVTVGRNGVVSANISAREIVVLGKVRGNMTASDRVDIRGEGSLTGDVVAQRISIEDGAYFKGGIDIRRPGQQKTNGEAKDATITPVETAVAATAARA